MPRLTALHIASAIALLATVPMRAQPLPLGSITLVNANLDHAALLPRIGANDGDSFRIA